jgi:type 1 glutamine amidotransferase
VLLVGGGSAHNFQKFFHEADTATLAASKKCVTAYTENAPEAAQLLEHADVLVLSANHVSFGAPAFQRALQAFADAGKGLVIVHAGTWYNWKTAGEYQKRFVGGGAKSHGRGEFQVIAEPVVHPVLEGVAGSFSIQDEHYRVELDPGAVEVLATTSPETVSQKTFPAVWVMRDPKARIACISLGHAQEAHSNPAYHKLLTNAVLWAGRHASVR